MDEIEVSELGNEHQRWLDFGKVGFLVRYVGPGESEKFRRRMISLGVARVGRRGSFEINQGRDLDFYEQFARQYVVDWRGNVLVGGERKPYSPETMALILQGRNDVLRAIQDALEDDDAFFGRGSNGSTPS